MELEADTLVCIYAWLLMIWYGKEGIQRTTELVHDVKLTGFLLRFDVMKFQFNCHHLD